MISDWIKNVDILSLVLGTVLGAVISNWYSYYVKRPKLVVIGSGGASGIHHSYGKKKVRIGCKMTKGLDGRLRHMTEGAGGGTF